MQAQSTSFGQGPVSKGRSQQEIQAEYAELCGKAGDLQYRVEEHKAALHAVNERLFSLNKEFMALKENKDKVKEIKEQMEQAPTIEETKAP